MIMRLTILATEFERFVFCLEVYLNGAWFLTLPYRILTTRLCCTSTPKTDVRPSKRRSNSSSRFMNRSVNSQSCLLIDHGLDGWKDGQTDEWKNWKWQY